MLDRNQITSIMEELNAVGLASAYSDEVKKYLSLEKYTLLEAYEPQSKTTATKGSEWD